jgi:ABC-type multidrug transport system fused ATPase/permease subunit
MTAAGSFFSGRLLLLRELRHGGAGAVSALIGLGLLGALVPASTALAIRWLVHEVLVSPGSGIVPLVVLGVAILVGQLAQVAVVPVQYRVIGRIDGARRLRLARMTAIDTTIDVAERPHYQQLVRTARADPDFWGERTPGQGATALLNLLLRWVGVLAAAVVLTSLEWWLAPLIIIPGWACRAVWRRQLIQHIDTEGSNMLEAFESRDWQKTGIEWTGGKEPRTFCLDKWAIDQSMKHRMLLLRPLWDLGLRSVVQQWMIAAIAGPPLLVAFTLIVSDAANSPANIASAAAVLAVSWTILNLLGFFDVVEIDGAGPGMRAFSELLSSLPAAVSPPQPAHAEIRQPGRAPLVRFEGVSFAYPTSQQNVLDRVNFELRPGELLALVGLNGAGKSTLIKLLSGLYRPTSGRITIDGTQLTDIDAWRGRLSVVFQDFVRYPLSLLDNVTAGYTAMPVDLDRAYAAARDAGLDKLVDELPRGWDTYLSRTRRGGVDLSGGQWQLVVLARAMYAMRSGAEVLVLDEPTAHLDVNSEFEVFQQLSEHRAQTGVMLISHRLSTVRLADRIALLAGGRIAESGTHSELMALEGTYAALFTTQAKRFNEGYFDLDAEVEEAIRP